jgi:hypothetical protein
LDKINSCDFGQSLCDKSHKGILDCDTANAATKFE